MDYQPKFKAFLAHLESSEFETNTTATGAVTIRQSQRNQLRKEGVKALLEDLQWLYGDQFDIVETKDGIVLVAENEPGDYTISWELKNTIKSIDYDPFLEATAYEESEIEKSNKKDAREAEKERKAAALEAKRAKKLAELEETEDEE